NALLAFNLFIKPKLFSELKHFVSSELMVDDEELLKYYGKMRTNAHRIGEWGNGHLASALYLGLSAHDHSCKPDAHIRFRGSTAFLRSPIVGQMYSDKLTVMYDNEYMYLPTKQR
ncbi:hypothetical protein PFISCL1PPCAC_24339, partial [Pristionchus fissidentatus]